MSAAFEAALRELRLADCTDPAAIAVAKLIIEFATAGHRDPEPLCALALQQLRRNLSVLRCVFQVGALNP
jgi:hypothetical protein